jgi:hypothetical protein
MGEIAEPMAGVDVVVVVEAGPLSPAGAALMLRWTVSPSLMPSYSFSRRSSAIAFPLYSQRCLSGDGAPLAASWACSWALSDATSAVGEQARVKVRGGLRDLTVMWMDEDADASPGAAALLVLLLLVPASLFEMGAGGWTTGIWRQSSR